ncbi:HEAT repeat domain-containing protein [Lysobacter capsici]|uniref:HEAT repeat domain-containing protein n=1 Tax=Lysobacter capsici TaxID=435897 RepID=UPI00177E6E07|nr:HEAT repeat domain-containing protein [Lysobacter capsici]UOF14247.1 HEAT repeat domain-containing protein [Lysobacter capsici]
MFDLKSETGRFRHWADGLAMHDGQWECVYEAWPAWYEAVLGWVGERAGRAAPEADIGQVLYAIARDRDTQYLVREIRKRHPDALVWLTRAALVQGEAEARWQLAVELGRLPRGDEAEGLLLALADDDDEYVRRRAIRSLASLGVQAAEALVCGEWQRADENQEWARMSALECLRELKSPRLAALLADALQGSLPHLRQYAQRLREQDGGTAEVG